jgi:hypothetical protein
MMMLPSVDQHRTVVGHGDVRRADNELLVRAAGLEQDVAMRMRMADQGRVHVQ